jgi:hypothetical protein
VAELVLEFVNPTPAPSTNQIDRMAWPQRRRLLQGWREMTVRELREAALRRPEEWHAVAGHACTVQLDLGVTRINTTRDPHNYARLAKAIIDELKLQPAYGGFSPGNHARPARLRDKHGVPMFVNQGWALWPDDTAEFVELVDATFHRGPTSRVVIRTKETHGVQEHAAPS